jgi:DNA-directed RNA polymerase subunit RPC12/RpoP
MNKASSQSGSQVLDVCPHCGAQLSPWQQVLLSVDRALMCKNCWYRIVLDSPETPEAKKGDAQPSKDAKK